MEGIVWLLVGLCAGAFARLLLPGRDPMGVVGTTILGLIGSIVGGLVGILLAGGDATSTPTGLVGSIAGAVFTLVVYRAAVSRRTA
jgi:uncharacterized membrane protein YeaQ/YmgE (transglycosylase-associated protein family)